MIICQTCSREMICTKTGVTIVFGQDHCYQGDRFQCYGCGASVIHTAAVPFYKPDAFKEPEAIVVSETP